MNYPRPCRIQSQDEETGLTSKLRTSYEVQTWHVGCSSGFLCGRVRVIYLQRTGTQALCARPKCSDRVSCELLRGSCLKAIQQFLKARSETNIPYAWVQIHHRTQQSCLTLSEMLAGLLWCPRFADLPVHKEAGGTQHLMKAIGMLNPSQI